VRIRKIEAILPQPLGHLRRITLFGFSRGRSISEYVDKLPQRNIRKIRCHNENCWNGVVQNQPFSGYTGARKLPAREGRISARRLSCGEAASLPGSGSPGLKRPEAQQRQPVWMAWAGHQFPWAFAVALGTAAAHETPMVQEELEQVQVCIAQVAAQCSSIPSFRM
jgi:hypothetical protein